jgi:predicted ATPase
MRADQPTEVWASFEGGTPGPAPPGNLFVPGQVLAGRYRIDERIGQGGMGVVFRATDLQETRTVAIKALFVPGGMPAEVHRFQREFRALARLQHPHVVSVHDYGHGEGVPYYVMEYVAGVDIHRLCQMLGGRLPVDLTVTLLGQLCSALAYVHGQGIVHRDIKPSNVMVMDRETAPRVKLMDFGLVQLSDGSMHLTQSGSLLGTVLYMAPEQAQGLPVDRRADLYALGAVLYELLTGQAPFTGETPVAIIMQHITQVPVPPRQLRPDVPPALEAAILRLLAKRPGERFSAADELWTALQDPEASRLVLPAGAPAGPARADVVFRAGLIGREAELARLGGWLDEAWQGRGRFVLVEGEAGVGKSRLVAEFAGQARLRGGRRLSGACYEREALPYSPIVAPLQEALSELTGGEAETLVAGLEQELARLMPQLDWPAVAMPPELDPGQARLRLFDAVTQLVTRLAARRPLLLVLNDLHWADAATLELLHYLVRNTAQDVALLVVGTSRREERGDDHPLTLFLQGLRREKLLSTVELGRLTPGGTRALLAGLLALDDPPAELAERIYRESEGNPFFVEEVLKGLVEEGVLVQQNGRWALGRAAEFSGTRLIPASVADVIRRRLGQVGGAGRPVLDCAAVLGRDFAFDVLRLAYGGDEDALLDALDDLLRARLIEEARGAREDRYRFVHAKIQEVLYEDLSAPRRRKLHRAAGAALERLYAARLDTPEVVGALAQHYAAGGDVPRALAYGLRAGDLARQVFANAEAVAGYRRALATVGDDVPDEHVDEVIAIQTGLGEVCHLVGEYEATILAFHAVLALLPRSARTAGERRVAAAEAWRRVGTAREVQGRYEEALKCFQRGFAELGEDDAFPAEAALLYKDTAWVSIRQAQYDLAINACQIGLQLARRAQDERIVAEIDDDLGVAYEYKGDYESSLRHYRAGLETRERLQDKSGMAKSLSNLGTVYWLQGLLDQAREAYERSLELCTATGHRLGMALVLNNLGNIYADAGDDQRSIAFCQRTLEICQQIGNTNGIAMAYNNLGETYEKLGRLDEALAHLQQAVTVYGETGERDAQASSGASLARVYLALNDTAQAIELAGQALTTAREVGSKLVAAEALQVLGLAHAARRDRAQAVQCLQESSRMFEELGNHERAQKVAAHLLE